MESSIGKRMANLIGHFNLNPRSFAMKIGTSDTAIRNILSEKTSPSYDITVRILETFNMISPTWLITGEGEMLKGPGENPPHELKDLYDMMQEKIKWMEEELLRLRGSDRNTRSMIEDIIKQLKDISKKVMLFL